MTRRKQEDIMTNKDRYRWILGLAAGVALIAAAAGCQDNTVQHGESFPGNDQTRDVKRFTDVQISRGAREDATLREYHFAGDKLNTLGQDRIDLMLADGDVYSTLVLYLDVPSDAQLAPRQQAVSSFLKDRGMKDDQIRLENGPNPKSVTAAVPVLPQQPGDQKQQPAAGGQQPAMTPMGGAGH
jgi:hypothetical protein